MHTTHGANVGHGIEHPSSAVCQSQIKDPICSLTALGHTEDVTWLKEVCGLWPGDVRPRPNVQRISHYRIINPSGRNSHGTAHLLVSTAPQLAPVRPQLRVPTRTVIGHGRHGGRPASRSVGCGCDRHCRRLHDCGHNWEICGRKRGSCRCRRLRRSAYGPCEDLVIILCQARPQLDGITIRWIMIGNVQAHEWVV